MRYLILPLLIVLYCLSCKKIPCSKNGPLEEVIIFNSDTSNYQTATVTKYKRGSNFTALVDSTNLRFSNGVGNLTVSGLTYNYFSSDYDYTIAMYPVGEVLKVTDIYYGPQTYMQTTGDECHNQMTFKVNGTEYSNADGFQLHR